MTNSVILTAAANPENQDRGMILESDVGTVLCVADGAGGMSGGKEAAMEAIEFVRKNKNRLDSVDACTQALLEMDEIIANQKSAGETTCVIAVVTHRNIFGASVGDSGAWFVSSGSGEIDDLSQSQNRKPLLGSSMVSPVYFSSALKTGCLLLASDGLLKYTSREKISASCLQEPIQAAADQLLALVKSPSGKLPDDVTIILKKI